MQDFVHQQYELQSPKNTKPFPGPWRKVQNLNPCQALNSKAPQAKCWQPSLSCSFLLASPRRNVFPVFWLLGPGVQRLRNRDLKYQDRRLQDSTRDFEVLRNLGFAWALRLERWRLGGPQPLLPQKVSACMLFVGLGFRV